MIKKLISSRIENKYKDFSNEELEKEIVKTYNDIEALRKAVKKISVFLTFILIFLAGYLAGRHESNQKVKKAKTVLYSLHDLNNRILGVMKDWEFFKAHTTLEIAIKQKTDESVCEILEILEEN